MGPAHQGGRHLCGLMATPGLPGSLVTALVTIGKLPVSRLANAVPRNFRDRWPV
jgi:hypothetical protein